MKETTTPSDTWSYAVLADQNFRDTSNIIALALAWWTKLASPPDAKPGATFAKRDLVRRGRIASSLMFFLALLLILAAPIGALTPNHTIVGVAITIWIVIAACIPLNRSGHVTIVGILMGTGIALGMYTSILTAPGGLSPNDEGILYLLFFPELFVAVLLPVNWVFLVAFVNLLFSVYVLMYAPHTPALTALLAAGGYVSTLPRLIQIHLIVVLVMWVTVKVSQEHLKRADRAEEVARLQHDYAHFIEQKAREKVALEQSITLIIEVHTRVANGDLDARVPLTRNDQMLWHVGGQLNNLLARYQNAKLELAQKEQFTLARQRMIAFYPVFSQAVSTAERSQRPLEIPTETGTALDPYLRELRGKYILSKTRPHGDSATSQLI